MSEVRMMKEKKEFMKGRLMKNIVDLGDLVEYNDLVVLLDKLLYKTYKEDLNIPLAIFKSDKLTILESLVKYLRENYKKSYGEIARLLRRDVCAIRSCYISSKVKYPFVISLEEPCESVSVELFANRKLSAFENLVAYLKGGAGVAFKDIAELLNRDYKTVWTIHARALKKIGNGR